MKYEDFDKYFIEIFMTYSLKDLTPHSTPNIQNSIHPLLLTDWKKDTMITDGYTAYVPIIEKLHMTHQKCVFHKISWKKVYLNVSLGSIIISWGFYSKRPYNNFQRTKNSDP